MSHVTDVILIIGCGSPTPRVKEFIDFVQSLALTGRGDPCPGLKQMDKEQTGGSKYLQCEIYSAAFNHWSVNIEQIVDRFKALRLGYLEGCVLIIQDEHDEHFRVYKSGESAL